MATQVEALLPGNPLAKAEEHGGVMCAEPGEVLGRGDGADRQTGVADRSGSGSTPVPLEQQCPKQTADDGQECCDSDGKPGEDAGKTRQEFTDAPPPKVNPWTRKMNSVTVVSVNGQTHHGLYSFCLPA